MLPKGTLTVDTLDFVDIRDSQLLCLISYEMRFASEHLGFKIMESGTCTIYSSSTGSKELLEIMAGRMINCGKI